MPGATVTVLGNTGGLAKAGHHFAGWNTAADGSGTAYAAGATFGMGTADVTLYAQWAAIAIPTLDPWLLMLLTAALLGMGAWRMRRRD